MLWFVYICISRLQQISKKLMKGMGWGEVVTVTYDFWQVVKVMPLGKSSRLTRAAVSTPISKSHHTAEDNLALFSRS